MICIQKLFDQYDSVNKYILGDNKGKKIKIKDRIVCNSTLKPLIESINYLKKISFHGKIKIIFEASNIADDSVIVVLETIIYHAIKNYELNIQKVSFKSLNNELAFYSALQNSILYGLDDSDFKKRVVEYFEKPKLIRENLLRFNTASYKKDRDYIRNSIYADINSFLIIFDISEEDKYELSTACIELIENSFDHTNEDVILSIKCLNVVDPNGVEKDLISVVVFNISDICLGDMIKTKYYNNTLNEYSHRVIQQAYDKTNNLFNANYDEDFFFMVSSFQRNVTSRDNRNKSGTGLTNLLFLLMQRAYDSDCYVLSKNRVLYFKKDFLKINEDGTIGFNDINSYIDDVPSLSCVDRMNNIFSGTLYSITLVEDKNINKKWE